MTTGDLNADQPRSCEAVAPAPVVVIGDRVLVQRDCQETKSESGLYLPEKRKDEVLLRGTVLATGQGYRTANGTMAALHVFPGQRVVWKDKTGVDVEIDGKKYVVLREADILLIFA